MRMTLSELEGRDHKRLFMGCDEDYLILLTIGRFHKECRECNEFFKAALGGNTDDLR